MRKMILISAMVTILFSVSRITSAQDWQKTVVVKEDNEKQGEPPVINVDVQPRERRQMIFRGPDMDPEINRRLERERELEEMRLNDPEKFRLISEIDKLERSAKETAEKYRQASEATEKDAFKEQLSGILDQLFELKVQIEEMEQKRLEKEAAKQKERIEKRKGQKKEIIQLRLDDLLGKNDLLRW